MSLPGELGVVGDEQDCRCEDITAAGVVDSFFIDSPTGGDTGCNEVDGEGGVGSR